MDADIERFEFGSDDGIALTDALDFADPKPVDVGAMVVKTVRVPPETDRAVTAAAAAEGVSPSAWIRRAIEAKLAGREPGELVNVEDVLRAVRALPRAEG
ncbi:ribbon-helix-helix domain-containing protein [Phytomonospora endophytica]|uniref:Putative transcriptional regulator n=1 Tax=Phytomonospora endophytica TaxID=714109 RepID=A0A841G4E1_9ACTN|nr:CopG family transcriptional regulator [Phytomonospora endophytica]MBB6038980.1 putative transcriptional regulator [Phytomonospora endophytica]GIG67916.1 hypothetical protein Pen01_42110 [Phytomonospora endophytica]